MQDLVGRTIGQYKIVEQIGRGGMASVYKGYQASLNRFVAIKVLAPGMAMDPTFLERFRREATSVAGLQHPNILPVYDFNQDPASNLFYIVMMLVGSGTLRDRIGTIPLPLSLRIASQLADALDFAHSRNVIHRDVKPSNVLMARDDWALLADFGIARLTEATGLTSAGTGIGTPEYMSPEQAMGQPVDGRADVYALGVVIYEMVTGQLPFSGADTFSIMRQQVQMPLPRPSIARPGIPAGLEAVILRACEKDPARRFQTAGELKAALDDLTTTPQRLGVVDSSTALVTASADPAGPTYDNPAPIIPPRSRSNTPLLIAGIVGAFLLCVCLPVAGLAGAAALGDGGLAGLLSGTATRTATATSTSTVKPGGSSTPTPGGAVRTPTPGGPTATRPPATPTPRVPPTAIPLGQPLFTDNMQANGNGWDLFNTATVKSYFAGGTYHFENYDEDTSWVSFPSRNRTSYATFAYEVDFTKIDGPDEAYYGLKFRADGVDGYNLLIRGDGVYQLTRYVDSLQKAGQSGYDRMIEPTRDISNVINTGNAKNRLKVVAKGPVITVYINDKFIGQVTETKSEARTNGSVGIVCGPDLHITVNAVRVFAVP